MYEFCIYKELNIAHFNFIIYNKFPKMSTVQIDKFLAVREIDEIN